MRDSWEEHQSIVQEFVAAAGALSSDQWHQPPGGDKWSASQIAEHLRLTYEVFDAELAGAPGLRVRTSWWLRIYLRLRYLGPFLQTGEAPDRVPAPREVRPGSGPFDREVVLDGIRDAVARFEKQLRPRWDADAPAITHHLFGRLSARETLRFAVVHTQRHREQLRGLV